LQGTAPGWTPHRSLDDKAALRAENIVCGSRNNRIRVSLAHYNDESDLRSLAQVLGPTS